VQAKLQEQRKAGLLQQLQPVHPRQHERVNGTAAARRRKLSSVGDAVGEHSPAVPDAGADLYAVEGPGAEDSKRPGAPEEAAAGGGQAAALEGQAAAAAGQAASLHTQQSSAAAAGVDGADPSGSDTAPATSNDTASSAPPSDGAPSDTVVNASAQTQHDEL
jgi:hypothetical protein